MRKGIPQSVRKHKRSSLVCACLLLVICIGCSPLFPGAASDHLTAFSSDSNRYDGHSWSPDGHWLAAEGSEDYIFLFTAGGQLMNNLDKGCDLGSGVEDMTWLPDGRLSCIVGKTPPSLGVFTLDHSGQVKGITTLPVPIEPQAAVLAIQWNPHSFWLATIANSQVGSIHIPALYISDLTGRLLFGPMLVDTNTLAWSHDGHTLALVLNDNPSTGNGAARWLHFQPTTAGRFTMTNTQQLAAGTASGENVEWSPSDRWLVCHFGSYESEDYLFLLASDGSGKRVKLTSSTTDGQLGYPSWSPDGKQLIVTRASDGALLSLDIAALLKEKGVEP